MSAASPILTIAVPSYNVERYLPVGIASYEDARLRDLVEVVVVDDGSTDATLSVARAAAEREPRIFRVVSKANGGHGSAVNAALEVARGRYFRVIDADDWATTDDLVRFAALLAGTSSDLVVDVKREVDLTTRAQRTFALPERVPRGVAIAFEEVCADEALIPFLMIHTLTVRTELLRSIGLRLLEHTFYEDFEYVVKATLDAADVTFSDVVVYNYLVGNASQSVADASYVRRFDDHARVTAEICDLLERRGGALSGARRAYLLRRATLIANTHYNIALIFDADRPRGLARARAFRSWLRAAHPEVAALTERRYRTCRILHALGVSSQAELDRLARRGR